MAGEMIAFFLISAICLVCAVGVVVANNPVHAGIFLGLCFVQVAGLFVMMGAEFLAVVQVIVYTGAILVLLVFVLLLVDPDDLPEFHAARPVQRAVGLLRGAVLLLEMGVAILGRTIQGTSGGATAENVAVVGGNTQALGLVLYTEYIFAFEVASLVLTVGVIGAIVAWTMIRSDVLEEGGPEGDEPPPVDHLRNCAVDGAPLRPAPPRLVDSRRHAADRPASKPG